MNQEDSPPPKPEETLLEEALDSVMSDDDIRETDRMVTVVLRSQNEIATAKALGLNPAGTTLVILKKDSRDNNVYSSDEAKEFVRQIKASEPD